MVDKQRAGFKFGKYRLTVLGVLGEVNYNERAYRLVKVKTSMGEEYLSLRLYNRSGKFIKQLLIEPEIAKEIAALFEF